MRLAADLDGGAVVEATTGVSASRPHGATRPPRRLGLKVQAAGDLDTGAHHTVEDVGIALGQARSTRRSATAPASVATGTSRCR